MKKFFLTLLLFLSLAQFGFAGGGQEVGNGGDPLHLIFRKAQLDAISIVKSFNPKSLDPKIEATKHFDTDIYEFLMKPHGSSTIFAKMPVDIELSVHKFIDLDPSPIPQSTCARTNIPSLKPTTIRLLLPKCRTLLIAKGQQMATKTLLHESVHHFGKGGTDPEEKFAWRVAEQLYAFWEYQFTINRPHWKALTLDGAPASRYQAVSVALSDHSGFIWGGCNYSQSPFRESCEKFLSTGQVLNVDPNGSGNWTPTSSSRVPTGRKLASGVYTGFQKANGSGQKVIVWGGCRGDDSSCSTHLSDGGVYDLERSAWTPLSNKNIPGRVRHSATWTGEEMLLFGGKNFDETTFSDLWSLTLNSGSWIWTKISVPKSVKPRYGHSAVWTGKKLIVWGGCARFGVSSCAENLNDGFTYTPKSGSFSTLPEAPIEGRKFHSTVWTGTHMIVWGGKKRYGESLADGAILDLRANSQKWTIIDALLPIGEQEGRYHHQANWTNNEMLIYGGEKSHDEFAQTTLAFSFLVDKPEVQAWNIITTPAVPIGRKEHSQFWFKDKLVIWGGYGEDRTFLPTGAVLNNPLTGSF